MNNLDEIEDNDGTWMLLSRNNKFLKEYEDWLRKKPVLYRLKGNPSVSTDKIKAINMFERFRKTRILSDPDRTFLYKYVDEDKMNLSKPWYDNIAMFEEDIEYYRDLIAQKIGMIQPRYDINTIHTVKGAEADNVVLLLDVSLNVFKNFDRDNDAEMRCYYVAATRAKKRLYIVHPNSKYSFPIL